MINKKFNIMLPYDMIAQAYNDHLDYGPKCFIVGPLIGVIPEPIIDSDRFYLEGFDLIMSGSLTRAGYKKEFKIENNHLILRTFKGGVIMDTVDLGYVRGPIGPQGPEGPEGPQGPQGPEGTMPPEFIVSFSDNVTADGTYTTT